MENVNERPVCHRAEDLVAYLYGEASEAEAHDFAGHVERCDACRAELMIFRQVHESILVWRNEALGSAFNRAPVLTEARSNSTQFVQHARKLSAVAALREFFSVSPLWLRGATAFAAFLLCVLAVVAVSRLWQRPVQSANNETGPKVYTPQQFDVEVERRVDAKVADLDKQKTATVPVPKTSNGSKTRGRVQLASNRVQPRSQRAPGLTRVEREQLAADLRLIPGRDDEAPFVFTEEPNQ